MTLSWTATDYGWCAVLPWYERVPMPYGWTKWEEVTL